MPVSAIVLADLRRRSERPAPVLRLSEERREARVRVEARKAAPVDGSAAVDQRRGPEIAEKCVVFDPPNGSLQSLG